MAKPEPDLTESPPMLVLRKFAMQFPEAEEGTSCVKRAFRARKKTYLYIGMKSDEYNVMVKLSESLAAAQQLQKKRPDNFQVGMHGWTTIRLPHEESPPRGLLESWIEESFRLLAPKALVDSLPQEKKTAKTAKKKTAKKKTAKKKTAKKKAR